VDYQIVQERPDLMVANLVASRVPSQEEQAQMTDRANQMFPGLTWKISFVDRLETHPGGKMRPFRSALRSDYQGIDWESLTGDTEEP
jgi:hypothetical protein